MKRPFSLSILFIVLLTACGTPEKSQKDILPQQEVVKSYVNGGWNAEDTVSLDQVLGNEYTRYLNGIQVVKGRQELKAYILNYQRAFPDLRVSLERTVESGAQVVAAWVFEGTNTGEFGEYLPTGKKARVSGVSIFTMDEEGKIEREDTYYNELYLLQQLGYTLNPPNLE